MAWARDAADALQRRVAKEIFKRLRARGLIADQISVRVDNRSRNYSIFKASRSRLFAGFDDFWLRRFVERHGVFDNFFRLVLFFLLQQQRLRRGFLRGLDRRLSGKLLRGNHSLVFSFLLRDGRLSLFFLFTQSQLLLVDDRFHLHAVIAHLGFFAHQAVLRTE